MTKAELRKKYLSERQMLSPALSANLSVKIFEQFLLRFTPSAGQKIHVFLPMEKFHEVDTMVFIQYFFEKGIRVFVPKVVGSEIISVEINRESIFVKNRWGTEEPHGSADADAVYDFVIVPLLYCDSFGNRIGYGKGFYDRFFRNLDSRTKKVGVNYFPPKEHIDDVAASDVPLDYLVLPDEVLSFGFTSKSTK